MRCNRCFGTGQYLGMGMILTDCDCDEVMGTQSKPVLDRRSRAYKESIAKLMSEANMSKSEAERLFAEQYNEL